MKKRYKILFVVEAMGGGVFTYIVNLSNRLIEEYDIYIAYATRPQTPANYCDYFDKKIHLIHVKNFSRSINLSSDVRAFFEIRKIAAHICPDVIHLHSSKAGILGRWAFNGRKTALFYTPHGYSFLMSDLKWVKKALYKGIEVISAAKYCTTISCSRGEHQETLKLTKRAVYVNNGICTAELDAMLNESCEVPHPFTVFTIGRICTQKNPSLFNSIAQKMPDIPFVWIGDGELRDQLTEPNIEITGWLSRKDALIRAMQADVFLLPSLWEGLPIALLEAMYMKKLCIVSNIIGNNDVIKNGLNGFLCETAEEFAAIIEKLKNGTNDEYINQAHTDIIDCYNLDSMAESYGNIYRTAIEDSRIPNPVAELHTLRRYLLTLCE